MACAIARRLNRLPLEAVFAYPPPVDTLAGSGTPVIDTRFDHDIAASAREYVGALTKCLALEAGGLETRALAVEGSPAEVIVGRVRDAGHDLVVMTTHGRSGPSRAWLGSVADRVVRLSPAPVLLGASRDSAQRHLTRVAEGLREQGMRVRTHVVINPHPAEAILDMAHEVNARLIAMALHGRHGAGRLLLGSVSDKVLRGAPVPILLQKPVS